ncbi:MAG TPA: UDP-N-acetylmuramoyl-L-alanyl-D-glutamate--2,6-diaminopimelate ligase, partial [Anaeromyxobacteraceae bacterium]|nr:UDP-N-acetylmuramoyl-L-alanyl-D-glutamate--2,6-diaminopimelate ligase [Anaeromyxobacteraceae bacterium]
RPLMGEAAGRGADLVIATSDNPRTEDPAAILAEIVPGLARTPLAPIDAAAARRGEGGFVVEPDRRAAIRLAIEAARAGDAVLVAGKGHEDYQLVGTERHPFDDREEARAALGVSP